MPSPINDAALSAQTFGEPALAAEILGMFRAQAPVLLQGIAGAAGPARADIAHRLKGSALAIGAEELAEAAARLEASPGDAASLTAVEAATAAVMAELSARGIG
jgi:HPt (histidine-containing phosphotransfer) domain-containing protein